MVKSASEEEIREHLKKLQAIKRASEKCLSQSSSIEAKFLDVINIMEVLQEILGNTKSKNEEKLRQANIAIKAVREEQNVAEEQKKIYQEAKEKALAKIKEAESQFQKPDRKC